MVYDIFYKGNTILWQEERKPWTRILLEVCAIAVEALPYELRRGNIKIHQQYHGERDRCLLSAELRDGQSSYWLMDQELHSRDITSKAIRSLSSQKWEDGCGGDSWTKGLFAEQIMARAKDFKCKENLPPSGVYHYGDFVAMEMNGINKRFMVSLSFADYAPQSICEHDLVLCAIATALQQIFCPKDQALEEAYAAVMEDLVIYRTKTMRLSKRALTKMVTLIRDEFASPATHHNLPALVEWEKNHDKILPQ